MLSKSIRTRGGSFDLLSSFLAAESLSLSLSLSLPLSLFLPALSLDASSPLEARLVGLHPERLVIGLPVLPASEPEENQMQIVRSRLFDQAVHHAEVKLALLRFD